MTSEHLVLRHSCKTILPNFFHPKVMDIAMNDGIAVQIN